jgi:hypothetical protein
MLFAAISARRSIARGDSGTGAPRAGRAGTGTVASCYRFLTSVLVIHAGVTGCTGGGRRGARFHSRGSSAPSLGEREGGSCKQGRERRYDQFSL